MNNLFTIIGRIYEINEFTDEDFLEIKVSVSRNYKNTDGIYETDLIPCKTFNLNTKYINEYCQVGDLIGVKGRIQCNKNGNLELIAEKMTFLASKRKEEKDE